MKIGFVFDKSISSIFEKLECIRVNLSEILDSLSLDLFIASMSWSTPISLPWVNFSSILREWPALPRVKSR